MLERNLVYVGKAFFPLKQKGGPLLKGQLCRALGSLILCKYPCKKGTMVIVPLIPLSKPPPLLAVERILLCTKLWGMGDPQRGPSPAVQAKARSPFSPSGPCIARSAAHCRAVGAWEPLPAQLSFCRSPIWSAMGPQEPYHVHPACPR